MKVTNTSFVDFSVTDVKTLQLFSNINIYLNVENIANFKKFIGFHQNLDGKNNNLFFGVSPLKTYLSVLVEFPSPLTTPFSWMRHNINFYENLWAR